MRIGMVGAGVMGAALGAGWQAAGHDVLTCLAGRSARTRRLAAGLTTVDSLGDVVRADVVVSVVPPGSAVDAARTIAAAARRAGRTPLVADLNAIAPSTVRAVEHALDGLPLLDGSISGPPPSSDRTHTTVYVCGDHELPAHPWVDLHRLDGPLGTASALKMCTASMYKGTKALVMQAMITAERHGVLAEFLADTARAWPEQVPGWPRDVALAVTKADRFADEMHEIARTQAGAGLPAALFDGVAAAYARAATTPAARRAPEDAADDALAELLPVPRGVLLDFSGTLFHNEDAAHALLDALGPDAVGRAAELTRRGAINGSTYPEDLPDHLADVWERRDLDADAHRAAYSGISLDAGLTTEEAAALYERGVSPEAWSPYPDTVRTVRDLRAQGVPVAIVSNIGWDPRPVLDRYGVEADVLVLSYERGVLKPDPEIFRIACAELGVAPEHAVMVGDNPRVDGGSEQLGVRFAYVDADPASRAPDALGRAVSSTSE